MTFGFIEGVYGDWKPGKTEEKDFGRKVGSEFWIIGEGPERLQRFADHGDSGSAVVDCEGVIRGIVFAKIAIKKLKSSLILRLRFLTLRE